MRNVTIVLNRAEIMGDVINAAHVTGRRLFVPGQEEKAADIQTPEEGVDKYIVARAMSAGLANVRSRCARYLTAGRLMDDDRLEDVDGDYVLNLAMPDRWNYGATTQLTSLMHAHVTDYCIYSIFEKTNPEEAAQYLTRAADELERIKGVLELRTAPVRRPSDKLY